jgi:hypothetical protein
MRDIERAIARTQDIAMRQLGSRAARRKHGDRLKRGFGEALRRARRAGLVFLLLAFALLAWDITLGDVGLFTWIVALPLMALAALASMTFPTRAARKPQVPREQAVASMPLAALAGRCEHWLADRCDELPRAALPAADLILARLERLQPALHDLKNNDPLSGEVRRLVGGHLPRLVDSYIALPPEQRDPRSDKSRQIAESLDVVAEELTRLCGEIDGCRAASFEIEHRFIESRYKEDESLRRR